MEDSLAFKYQFTHESGRKYIAQSRIEFYTLQMGEKVSYKNTPEFIKNFKFPIWGGRSYVRLGYEEFPKQPSKEQHDAEERVNRFWKAAEPAKKLDKSLFIGYSASGVLLFLYGQANHAIMMGDKEAYDKAYSLLPFRRNILALPSPKEN